MDMRRRWFRLRTGGGREAERELREEIEAHIALRVEDQVRRGVPERQAREEALRRFGDPETAWRDLRASVRRRERRLTWREWGDRVLRSLVLTYRHARRAPGFVALSVLTLGVGTGLTTASYTVIDRVLLRPLPYVEPDRLVALHSQSEDGSSRINVSVENWLDWKEENATLDASALHRAATASVGVESGARRVRIEEVTGDFFRVMRTPMIVGRGFTDEEAQAGERVVVVSESFWRSHLGSPQELPTEVRLDGRIWQVIGVVPESQAYPEGRQIWVPYQYRSWNASARNWINWNAVARLADGVTIDRADMDLDRIARGIRERAPEALYSWGVWVDPLRDIIVGDVREDLDPLLATALFILLIGCANVAGMSLARTLSRGQEVAVHVALGAGRGRIVRQIVAEHVYLGLAGGALGLFIAWASLRLLVTRVAFLLPRANEIAMDGRILAVGIAASVIAGVLAGAIPGWRASGVPVRSALSGSRGTAGSRSRAGAFLVATEVAVALVLLASCGLLIRSFVSLMSRDLGYRIENVVAAEAVLNTPTYDYARDDWEQRRVGYWEDAMERARAVAGVRSVAVGNWIPTGSGANGFIEVAGWPEPDPSAGYRAVSADYFEVLGIPLITGRLFDERDRAGSARVTVINQAMADKYWAGQNPIGQTVHAISMEGAVSGVAPPLTVVGVVGNVRHFGFDSDSRPEMFTVWSQVPLFAGEMTLLAYAPGMDADELALRLQQPMAQVDPDLAVDVATLEERAGAWTRDRRFIMSALTALAGVALGLAGIGIFGLLSFTVAQRTREMGIRAALGSNRIGIVGLMMSRAARVYGVGVLGGLVLSFWMTRTLRSMLVDVAPADPLSYGVALVTLAVCCALAAFVPAWRAARTDPLVALRA
jgi:predicted permease